MRYDPLLRRVGLSGLLAALVLALSISSASAGRTKSTKAKTPEKHETTIGSVSATSITVNEDKTPKTYAISQLTEVTVNGQHATIADLKPGMNVSLTLTDPTRISRISATNKQ